MFNLFVCGSFHHQEEDDGDDAPCGSPRSPPGKWRKSSLCRSKDSKNPYANRGLDKFSALLADLADKRQRIYTQMGSEEDSLVRFVYSSSNDWKPIVVKLRDKKKGDRASANDVNVIKHKRTLTHKKPPIESSDTATNIDVQQPKTLLSSDGKTKRPSFSRNISFGNWRRPSYYMPAILILTLVLLALFGRSFVIVCTSIAWYLVPTIEGASSSSARRKKKREYTRRLSGINKNVDSSAGGLSFPRTAVITRVSRP